MTEDAKISCYTPTQGKAGATRIPMWKYECVRAAILTVLSEAADGQVQFKDLPGLVKPHLTPAQLDALGSLGWHVTTVKLNMEVEGEIERIPNASPQRLRPPR